jgi:hypothetical protein
MSPRRLAVTGPGGRLRRLGKARRVLVIGAVSGARRG